MGRPLANTNIAAVEPYHHVPSSTNNHYQPALDVKRNHRKGDQSPHQQQQQQQQHHHIQQQQQQQQHHHQQQHLQHQHQNHLHQQQQQQYHQLSNSDVGNHQQRKPSGYHQVHNQKEIVVDEQRTQFSSDDERRQQQHQQQQQQQMNKYNSDMAGDGCKSDDRVLEFWPNKFDSKYQTLPSGTKFSVAGSATNTKYIIRRPAEGVESHDNNNQKLIQDGRKYSAEDNFNNNVKDSPTSTGPIDLSVNDKNNNGDSEQQQKITTNSNGLTNQSTTGQMQQTNIVRSIPISSSNNKGLATPISNINYLPRSTTCSTVGNTTTSR